MSLSRWWQSVFYSYQPADDVLELMLDFDSSYRIKYGEMRKHYKQTLHGIVIWFQKTKHRNPTRFDMKQLKILLRYWGDECDCDINQLS